MKPTDKPHCCHPSCDQNAEYQIYPRPAASFEDVTECCEQHVGSMLGTTGDHTPEYYAVYAL